MADDSGFDFRTRQEILFRSEQGVKLHIEGYRSKGNGRAMPLQAWTDLECSRKLRLSDFETVMKVVRLSSLCNDRLYPLRNIPGTHFC